MFLGGGGGEPFDGDDAYTFFPGQIQLSRPVRSQLDERQHNTMPRLHPDVLQFYMRSIGMCVKAKFKRMRWSDSHF